MKALSKKNSKKLIIFFISLAAIILCFTVVNSISAQAKTITITSPEDLRDINWKNKGFGPGNKYVIGADMTLGDGEYATCRLTKGSFVIDFNGHTVQNANNALGVFSISGANVTFVDSKVSSSKASVRSYGAGAIDMTAGKLVIKNGNYVGLSNGTNNPCALHVGGGTCVVNGGFFYGETIGADCTGATLYINGGTFQTGYMFALADFGSGNIKISKADLIAGTTTYGYRFAIGAFSHQQYYDFNKWLAKGSSYSTSFQTGYWNMQSSVTAYPAYGNYYAVSYNTPSLFVTSNVKKPAATKIKKLTPGSKQLKVSYKKVSGVSGYEIQLATNKRFSKNKKTVTVKGAKNGSKTVKALKSGKKYYIRVRTYKNFNGTKLYSKWSATKTKTVK